MDDQARRCVTAYLRDMPYGLWLMAQPSPTHLGGPAIGVVVDCRFMLNDTRAGASA